MKSYFFNAVPTTDLETYPSGYDRGYDADDHAAFFTPFFSEAGVMAGRDAGACMVKVQSGSTLAVSAGAVYIRGRMTIFDGTETITVSQDCKIVVRMDKSTAVRDFQLLAVRELVRTEDVYDLELASVTLTAVAGGHEARLTDTRTFLSYMGQPAYYPPDSDSLPYVLWLYTLGLPMTSEQRDMVEANTSLMSAFNGSLGAARAVSVAFTAAEWRDGVLTIPKTKHGRQSGKFSHVIRHKLADGSSRVDTWAAAATTVSYDTAGGHVTLRCDDAYGGEIVFVGAAVGLGSVDSAVVENGAVEQTVRNIDAAASKAQVSAQNAQAAAQTAAGKAGEAAGAAQAVQYALDNLPEGAVPVINDLTTGGTTAALSAQMGKALNEALHHKVNVTEALKAFYNSDYGNTPFGPDAATWPQCAASTAGGTQNVPGDGWGTLLRFGAHRPVDLFYAWNLGKLCLQFNKEGYIPLATATPPEGHYLPLAEGIALNNGGTFRKTQYGRVTLYIFFKRSDSTSFPASIDVGTFPSGYRPVITELRKLTLVNSSGEDNGEGRVVIYADGRVVLTNIQSGSVSAYGEFGFWTT